MHVSTAGYPPVGQMHIQSGYSPVIPSLNTLTSPAPPEIPRKKTGVDVLDRALSGGMVIGSSMLLCGEAGVGKTTVVMKACAKMAAPDFRIGYVTSEQQDSLLLHRAREIGAVNEHFEICRTQDVAQATLKARTSGWQLCVFDSLQEFVGARLRDFQFPPTRIFISRMNKEGGIWGSTDNEHDPDVLLMCEYAAFGDDLRLIKANKNRYGATGSLATSYYTIGAAGVEEWVDPDGKKEKKKRGKKEEEVAT